MLLIGLLLYVVAEIACFVIVAEQIGFLWALTILILVSVLGLVVVRHVGAGALAHTRERLARGEVPTREVLDGLVILVGAVLICVPGFIGDLLGLLLMVGPVRRLVIKVAGYGLARRVTMFRVGRRFVVDTSSHDVGHDSPSSSGPPGQLVGPQDRNPG